MIISQNIYPIQKKWWIWITIGISKIKELKPRKIRWFIKIESMKGGIVLNSID
jgi:hypothetical protein